MCGRYVSAEEGESLAALLRLPADDAALRSFTGKPRYNICPGQDIFAASGDGERRGRLLHWGLVPFWSKDRKAAYRMINARSETVFEKPAFRRPVRARRCVVPATGFYEWRRTGGAKQPYFIRLESGEPMLLAAVWDHWDGGAGEGPLDSVAMLTREADAQVQALHDRMPLLLTRAELEAWLDPETSEEELRGLMARSRSEPLELYPVSTAVNSPRHEGPDLIARVEETRPLRQGDLWEEDGAG